MSVLLVEAIQHYEALLFKMIDVPYVVDYDVSAATKPDRAKDLIHNGQKVYVGSGEQSFIQLMKEGTLKEGRFMCLTPCYRDEPLLDDLHLRMFLKLELISLSKNLFEELKGIIQAAYTFFSKYSDNLEIIQVDEFQYDILNRGIEIGSYGIRECVWGEFVYGTGLALPRWDYSQNH